MTAEEEVDAPVSIELQELADDLEGKDLCIRELGCGSAATDASPVETVVDEAEDGHDEGAKIIKDLWDSCFLEPFQTRTRVEVPVHKSPQSNSLTTQIPRLYGKRETNR